ncbi:Kinesin-like protein KIN-10B [Bienertia sinuspersici]
MANTTKSSTPAKSTNSTVISKVRVIIRLRPFLPHDIAANNENQIPCVSILPKDDVLCYTDSEVSVHLKDPETSRQEFYKLDGFYEQEDYNIARIYEKEVKPLIPGIFNGCNATVFAYGATGSGKTYTMQGTDVQPGLMPLAMSTVLSMCQATGNIAEISYYEVYLDRCYDLLEFKAKEIAVLDDKEGHVNLRGLSRVLVTSMSEFHDVFSRGIRRRKVAHTGLNDVSSRSHGVLVLTVSKPDQRLKARIIGKLNLIDLAGNEDNRRSGNEGIRLQESAKINQSLFALSNVIYALNNNKAWVPYRETKLTRILQDSLGGTSRALMIACLNPADYQEAVHTVSLAARSRHISNVVTSEQKQETPKVKIDMEAKLRAWLESKGKTKSAVQRNEAFGSPFFLKSPCYISSMKKQAVSRSSLKKKAANGVSVKDSSMFVSQRKLFDTEATSDACKVDSFCVQESEGLTNSNITTANQVLTVVEDGQLHRQSVSQDFANSEIFQQVKEPFAEDRIKQCVENEEENSRTRTIIQSPPNRLKISSCQSPLRKALSPVNLNINRMAIKEVSSRDIVHSLLVESSPPKTPFVVTREKFQEFDTPLDKFNARSSNLKSCLVEEYIDFLNTATREQLLELKGIGMKRAEYIMELRESSPLNSLNDLQKIGLSSKQVQFMFSKAAKDIFV